MLSSASRAFIRCWFCFGLYCGPILGQFWVVFLCFLMHFSMHVFRYVFNMIFFEFLAPGVACRLMSGAPVSPGPPSFLRFAHIQHNFTRAFSALSVIRDPLWPCGVPPPPPDGRSFEPGEASTGAARTGFADQEPSALWPEPSPWSLPILVIHWAAKD